MIRRNFLTNLLGGAASVLLPWRWLGRDTSLPIDIEQAEGVARGFLWRKYFSENLGLVGNLDRPIVSRHHNAHHMAITQIHFRDGGWLLASPLVFDTKIISDLSKEQFAARKIWSYMEVQYSDWVKNRHLLGEMLIHA